MVAGRETVSVVYHLLDETVCWLRLTLDFSRRGIRVLVVGPVRR